MKENKNAITALVFTCLMLISPIAGAASITTFSGGDSEVTVEVRDGPDFTNIVDGTVSLPSGDTVTSASVTVSTDFATHETYTTINSDTAQYVWDPFYNIGQTNFSNQDDFTYTEDSIQLVGTGFTTDFESTDGGFIDASPPNAQFTTWSHGIHNDGTYLNNDCYSGNECWGTNAFDIDNDYRNDNDNSSFEYEMISPVMEVDPLSFIAKFESWHGLYWNKSGTSTNPLSYYYDCAYVMVKSSSMKDDAIFNDPNMGTWTFLPFDAQNSSGVNYANGLYQVGSGNGKIQTCGSLSGTDYALGGESTHPTTNPDGWATLALNLKDYIQSGKYVQLKFVMEHNAQIPPKVPENSSLPGWFIDDFRLGNLLPQSGWMTVKNFMPRSSPNPGFPDGYGVLTIEQETTATNSLTLTAMKSGTTEVVVDTNGNQMTGLEGPIIELWDIDSSVYPAIDLRFDFDSGTGRLSTAVLHGITIGTRIGTGFNGSDNPEIFNGVWNSPGMGMLIEYSPMLVNQNVGNGMQTNKFSQPIIAMTPRVLDDCSESAAVQIITRTGQIINLTTDSKYVFDEPIFGFNSFASYQNPCGMSELWFDIEFGHSATGVTLDVANDGDVEWGMDDPAFGAFGRQTKFWAGTVDGVNYGMDEATMTLNVNGQANGGTFMLPMGADVVQSEIVFDGNTAGDFDIELSSSGQNYDFGTMPNTTTIAYDTVGSVFNFTDGLNSLLNNPLLQVSHTDEFGNDYATFRFNIENVNAASGTQVTAKELDIVYNWEKTLGAANNIDREMNQGIALGTGTTVDVPFALDASSGGAVKLSSLSLTTDTGYDSTLTLTGSPEGLYPNGDIVEAISTHTVQQSTGTSFAEARLRMESSSGLVELQFSELSLFGEAYDPDNLVTMESSTYQVSGDTMEVTWRFRINTAWEDTPELRMYASLIATNGVKGLPGAIVLAPENGNAIENDAVIASFELQNNAGVVQDLTSASSNQNIRMIGTVRLEGLNVAPDPTSYNLSLQKWDVQTINGSVVSQWMNITNLSNIIGGNFDWNVNLGITAAGVATYRVLIDGYSGGDTLCPPTPIVADADCAIPFNLSIDTYSPTLINISVLKASNYDPSIWSNWRNLVDDTWVLPNQQQKVRILAQDIPSPPTSIDMYYWIEYDHDYDGDGLADPDEYTMVTLNSDGNAPIANYTGTFSDDANKGQDPPGKVSIYAIGSDLGGNAIDGGGPGFDNDLVTYVSMDAKTPNIRNFFIEDNDGNRLHNPSEGAPFYQGPWNMTMYAGKEYHLIVEAADENGWRDINYFEIDLGPENMVVYYSPRNESAWSDSDAIEIVEASNTSNGPEVLRMDGGRLIDPFEDEFYLDLPIRMKWDITGITTTTYVPQLRIKDMDRDPSLMSESGGRHKQRWVYSDGIQLDYRNGITPTFDDISAPFSSNIEIASVFPGDTISFTGQYAYIDGINNGVYVLPEGEFTVEITRAQAFMDGDKGYLAYPAGGADGSKTDGPTLHTINGGGFSINITAPPISNDYQYSFRLVNLPDGAVDSTDAICSGSSAYGCGSFSVKVDGTPPEVKDNTWNAKSGINGEELGNTMPSSTMHCVDVQAVVEENAALLAGEVDLYWSFYSDATTNLTWPVFGQKFGIEPLTEELDVKVQGSDYLVSAECVDLWPDPIDPTQAQITQIDLIMWIEGSDSAGWSIRGGGPDSSGGISSIWSSEPEHNSQYRLVHEQAKFSITEVRMTPKAPEVGEVPELEITVQNIGTQDGNITLEIQSVVGGGFPTTETTLTTNVIAQGTLSNVFVTDLEEFASPTSGMYFLVVDAQTNEVLWNGSENGKSFNVAVASADDGLLAGSGMLIVVGLGTLILVLLVVVVVLARRNSGDGSYEYEYDYEEDKDYVDIPQASSPAGPPPAGPPVAQNVDPLMAAALAEFPQWDQATIQGYFDQGWDIDSLRDWVQNNQ